MSQLDKDCDGCECMAPERNPLHLCRKCCQKGKEGPNLRSSPASAVTATLPEDAARFPAQKEVIKAKEATNGTQGLDSEDPSLANSTLYSTKEAAMTVAPTAGMSLKTEQQDEAAKAAIKQMQGKTYSSSANEINPDRVGKTLNAPRELARKYDTHGGSRFGANMGHQDQLPSRAEILRHDRGTGNPQSIGNADATKSETSSRLSPNVSHSAKQQQQDRARTAVGWLRTLAGRAKL